MPEYRKATDFLTVEQAAVELRIARATAYRLISQGLLRAGMRSAANGGRPRLCVPRAEIDRYLGGLAKTRKASA